MLYDLHTARPPTAGPSKAAAPAHTTSPTPPPTSRPSRSAALDDTLPGQQRSLSRKRRFRLPSPPPTTPTDECCCCADLDAAIDQAEVADMTRRNGARRASRDTAAGNTGKSRSGRSSKASSRTSSDESLASAHLTVDSSSTSSSSTRPRLFDDSDDDQDDDLLSLSFGTSSDGDSLRSFSPATPVSWNPSPPPFRRPSASSPSSLGRSPSLRKSSVVKSDPLLCPSTPPPAFSFGRRGEPGHWLPSPPETTSYCAATSPELPDVLPLPSLSPPPSPPRRLTPPISLLTKSLRSLSRLPNLLPGLPTPQAYLATSLPSNDLAPGWGPAERRRVLAEEPSHAADEARMLTALSRHRPSSAARTPIVDEVEAAVATDVRTGESVEAGGVKLDRLDPSGAKTLSPPPSPTSPTADLLPLPHVAPPSASPALDFLPSSPTPTGNAGAEDAPPPLPPRFISNTRHLLMLSLEFEMMRHAKIRGPLRQRAVIVRPAPPSAAGMRTGGAVGAGGGKRRRESGLRREVSVC
ncbi:hypothetical protein JCM8097_005055 [Rhodosporidiobolus ruineniae]